MTTNKWPLDSRRSKDERVEDQMAFPDGGRRPTAQINGITDIAHATETAGETGDRRLDTGRRGMHLLFL